MKLFLNNDSKLLAELRDKKIESNFDIGFTINAPDYVARFLDLDKDLLKEMTDANVGLSIASYLASEDEL